MSEHNNIISQANVSGWLNGKRVELVSVTVAAKILGYAPRTIRQYADEGKLPATKIGRAWYVYPHMIPLTA